MYIVDTRFISYWYFLDEVTGPSATEGFFEEGEAFRTQIMTFESNSVHSNGHTGFLFGSELQPDQDFNGGTSNGGTEKCNPRKHPKDPNSEAVSNVVKSLTAFKNIQQNSWSDCRRTTFDGYRSSDSIRGYTQKFDSDIINSIFIGDSGKFLTISLEI